MKYILFSHGFGVKKDSRGMFTDIAKSFSTYKPIMFDYNVVVPEMNQVIVEAYSKQAKILSEHLDGIHASDPNATITLIGHSQGCIIPCLIHDIKIDAAILLAPPMVIASRRRNQNAIATSDGSIKIPRKDGSVTVLTKGFIDELQVTKPPSLYRELASRVPTTIIVARQDEMLQDNDLTELSELAEVVSIDGDHNFTGKDRQNLLKKLSTILS